MKIVKKSIKIWVYKLIIVPLQRIIIDMNHSATNTYLNILRAAIWRTPLSEENISIDTDHLVGMCRKQGTEALVYSEVLAHPELKVQLSEQVQIGMKQVCMSNMQHYESLQNILHRTWIGLKQGGVSPVVLKGFGLAMLYPQPYLRQWGDLDVYVGPGQYHQAAEVLRTVFPEAMHHEEEWEELKHYNFVLPHGLVEMHRTTVKLDHPVDSRLFQHLEDEAMRSNRVQHVEYDGMELTLPEMQFNLFYTFLHAWIHFVEEGLGMKQLCDVALLMHHTHEHTDRETLEKYLWNNLRRLHLTEPWMLIGYVSIHALGLPANEWPLYHEDKWISVHGPEFLTHVLSEGMVRPKDYGDSTNRYEARDKAMKMNILARKWLTLRTRMKTCNMLRPYTADYTRHMKATILIHGILRTLSGKKMEVMY